MGAVEEITAAIERLAPGDGARVRPWLTGSPRSAAWPAWSRPGPAGTAPSARSATGSSRRTTDEGGIEGMPEPRVMALIPARGGSKGLPRKNVLPVAGKPLIAYSIIQ